MPQFVFSCPVDGLGRVANLDEISQLLRTRGEGYWNHPDGSGFAGLSFFPEGNGIEPGVAAGLDFTKVDRLGCHLYYRYEVADLDSPYYREAEHFKSYAGGPLSARSRVGWAGEGRLIFDALFVPVEAAVEAVREFLDTGGRSPRVGWITNREVIRAERALAAGRPEGGTAELEHSPNSPRSIVQAATGEADG